MRTISEIRHPKRRIKIIYLVFSLVFMTNISFAQKIEPGRYVSVIRYDNITKKTIYNADFTEEITFLDSLNFKYRYSDDVADERGVGRYSLFKNKLILNFTEHPENIDRTRIKVIDSSLSDSDSLTLEIAVIANNKPLEDAFITYYIGSNLVQKKGSNKFGKASLTISKNQILGEIRISKVGFESVTFNVTDIYNKSIIIKLDIFFNIIEKGEVLTYLVKEIDEIGFYAISWNYSDWTFFKRLE